MKQNSGDNRCVAIVAALATNTPVQEFEKFANHEPPYNEYELAHFLFQKGFACNLGFGPEFFQEQSIDVGDSENPEDKMYISKYDLTPDTVMDLRFQVKDYPAFLVVKPEGKDAGGIDHVIYWDGEMIHDPNPMTPNGRPFMSYKILKYFPIIKLT